MLPLWLLQAADKVTLFMQCRWCDWFLHLYYFTVMNKYVKGSNIDTNWHIWEDCYHGYYLLQTKDNTLTGHFNRYTLLVSSWTKLTLKVLETVLTDSDDLLRWIRGMVWCELLHLSWCLSILNSFMFSFLCNIILLYELFVCIFFF